MAKATRENLERKIGLLKKTLAERWHDQDELHDLLDSYGVPRTIVDVRFGTTSITLKSRVKKVCQAAYAKGKGQK